MPDICAGAPRFDGESYDQGSAYILFVDRAGTVESYQAINGWHGHFTGLLDSSDHFGDSCGKLGDMNDDGVNDVLVSAPKDDDGGSYSGAIYLLALRSNGTVLSHQKISQTHGDFTGDIYGTYFGAYGGMGEDLNGDGVIDIAVGAYAQSGDFYQDGAVYMLFLTPNATVLSHQLINSESGNFTVDYVQQFGYSCGFMTDLDGDGIGEILAGSPRDSDGGTYKGAVFILFLNPLGGVRSFQKISSLKGNFTGELSNYDNFGTSSSTGTDFNGDGITDILAGAHYDSDGGYQKGAVYMLYINSLGKNLQNP